MSLYPRVAGLAVEVQQLSNAEPMQAAALPPLGAAEVVTRARRVLERIVEAIESERPAGAIVAGSVTPQQIRYFTLKEQARRVRRLAARISDSLASARRRVGVRPTVAPARRRKGVIRIDFAGTRRRKLADILAAEDIHRYLDELTAESAEKQPDDARLDSLRQETTLLEAMHRAAGQPDHVLILCRSLVRAAKDPLDRLARAYECVFGDRLLCDCSRIAPEALTAVPDLSAMQVSSPFIWPLGTAEAGTHLLSGAQGNLTPVQVIVVPIPPDRGAVSVAQSLAEQRRQWLDALYHDRASLEHDPFPVQPVVRVYTDRGRTLDLRTGLSVEKWPTPDQFRTLLLAGLAPAPEFQETCRREGWRPPQPMANLQLGFIEVSVRPEYRTERGKFSSDEHVPVRVAYVSGVLPNKTKLCTIPTLDLTFHCHADDPVEKLAADNIQAALAGLAPRELARHLPPKRFELASVTVKVRAAATQIDEPELAQLKLVAEPLSDRGLRRRFGRAWERDRPIADLVARLTAGRGNVLLVGDGGIGKTGILVDAVRQFEGRRDSTGDGGDDEPKNHEHRRKGRVRNRFWLTSGARLIAGMQYLGQWEQRCEAIVEELSAISGVLCVENLLDLVRHGGTEPTSSVAAFFVSYLQRDELRMVAEATPTELAACRRLLPGLAELFQIVPIEPLDRVATRTVLEHVVTMLRQNTHLEADDGAIDLVSRLFQRFLPYRPLPGPAVLFLRQLWEQGHVQKWPKIAARQVLDRFTRDSGLPEFLLRAEIPLPQNEVLAEFERKVIGQHAACQAAGNLVTTFKAGLNDPGRPLGVLLFCGPTGVGKTELAKTLASYLFGAGESRERLVRLDMSEYAAPGSAQRLLVQSDGQPGELIKRVRAQPFTVLLLDEIEKAASDVFDVLLGVLDEGRLTDRFGRTTTFRSAIVIMTSNLGSEHRGAIGFDAASPRAPEPVAATPSAIAETTSTAPANPGTGYSAALYERAVTAFFRPEFFNRVDAVVTFNPLSAETILAITRKELAGLSEREGLRDRGLRLCWSEAVVQHLARAGFDARYGARPLQRTLERHVVAALSRWLLQHPDACNATLALEHDECGEIVARVVAQPGVGPSQSD